MPQVDVNFWAVLVGGVTSMVIGYIWYHPAVFGKTWMKELGKSEADLKNMGTGASYLMMFVGALVLAYIMAHFASYAGAHDVSTGAMTGFWAWLGFAATTGLSKKLFQGSSWTLFAVDYGYHLVQFVVVAAIVASWMK